MSQNRRSSIPPEFFGRSNFLETYPVKAAAHPFEIARGWAYFRSPFCRDISCVLAQLLITWPRHEQPLRTFPRSDRGAMDELANYSAVADQELPLRFAPGGRRHIVSACSNTIAQHSLARQF